MEYDAAEALKAELNVCPEQYWRFARQLRSGEEDDTVGEKLRALVSAPIPARELEDGKGWTKWHSAIQNWVKMRLSLVLNPRLDLEARNSWGGTLLQDAVQHGDLDRVKVLVEAGAEFKTAFNPHGESVLFLAASWGKLETAQWLRWEGAPWLRSCDPVLAAQLACLRGCISSSDSSLLSWLQYEAPDGTDWEGVVRAGRTAGMIWAQGEDGVCKALAEGTDVNTRLLDGRTLLMFSRNESIFQLLVSKGADVMARDEDGQTVLHWACRKGYEDVVKAAAEAGREALLLNAVDKEGRTGLTWASLGWNDAVVKWLVEEAKADGSLVDKEGKTALDWARERRKRRVVKILEGK